MSSASQPPQSLPVYESETVVVEEYVEREREEVSAPQQLPRISEEDLRALEGLARALQSLGVLPVDVYGELAQIRRELISAQATGSAEALRSALSRFSSVLDACRLGVLAYTAQVSRLVEYRASHLRHQAGRAGGDVRQLLAQVEEDLGRLRHLVGATWSATAPSQLLTILREVQQIHERYRGVAVDVGAVLADIKAVIEASADPNTRQYLTAVVLLGDRNRLLDLLTRYYLLLNLLRRDTYESVTRAYGPYIEALRRVLLNNATLDDLWNAVVGAGILLDMESRGYLSVERYYTAPEAAGHGAVGAVELRGAEERERYFRELYERYRSAVARGEVPPYQPTPIAQVAEVLGVVDPFKHIHSAVAGALRSVLPPEVAGAIATGLTSALLALTMKVLPPLGVALYATTIASGLSEILATVDGPFEREQLVNFIKNNPHIVAANIAAAVAGALAGGYVGARLKPHIYDAVASAVERFNPALAAKIRAAAAEVKLAVGTPEYESKVYQLVVDRESGTVTVRLEARGVLTDVKVVNLKQLHAYLADPQNQIVVKEVVGRIGDPELAKLLLQRLDDAAAQLPVDAFRGLLQKLAGMSPENLRALAVVGIKGSGSAVAVPGYDQVILVSRAGSTGAVSLRGVPDDELALVYLSERLGIRVEDLATLIGRAKEVKGLLGEIKGVRFESTGDNLVVTLPGVGEQLRIPIASVNTARLVELYRALSGLSSVDRTAYQAVLEAIRGRLELLSPQSPVVSFVLRFGDATFTSMYVEPLRNALQQLSYKAGATTRILTQVDGRPVEVTYNTYLLSGDKLTAVLELLRTRVADPGLLKQLLGRMGFREEAVAVLRLSRGLPYLPGRVDAPAVAEAIAKAASAGDVAAVQELTALLAVITGVERGTVAFLLTATSTEGFQAVVTGAGAGLVRAIQESAQTGNYQQLVQVLQQAGLQTQLAQRVALQLLQQLPRYVEREVVIPRVELTHEEVLIPETLRGVAVPVVLPQYVEKRVVVPKVEFIHEELAVSELLRGVAVPVVLPQYVKREVVVPRVEFAHEELPVPESLRGVAIPVVLPQYIEREVVIPRVETVDEELAVSETLRGVVIPVVLPRHVEREKVIPVPQYEYEEELSTQRLVGYMVVVPVTEVVVIPMFVDVEEEEPTAVAPPSPPTAQPSVAFPPTPPPAETPEAGRLAGVQPPPKGKKELEQVIY